MQPKDLLEVTKLRLLSHSKNMLNAAKTNEWAQFTELERGWMVLLKSSTSRYGEGLNSIGSELIKDSQAIQACIECEQKTLLEQLGEETKNTASIKSYLA